MPKPKRTRWLPAGWGIVCSHKLDGNGWRFEASIGGEIVARAGQFRTNSEADRAAKRALRAYARPLMQNHAGVCRIHLTFGNRGLCGFRFSDRIPSRAPADCPRCLKIVEAIDAELRETR